MEPAVILAVVTFFARRGGQVKIGEIMGKMPPLALDRGKICQTGMPVI